MKDGDTAKMEMAAAFQRGIGQKKLSAGARTLGADWLRNRVDASSKSWSNIRAAGIRRAENVGRQAASAASGVTIQKTDLDAVLRNIGRVRVPCPF